MAYAIFLIKKLKTWGQIAGSASHVQRTRETPNADPSKENIWLIGNQQQNLVSDTKNYIGKQTIRKNGVLCVELLLSASPEFFRPGCEEQVGEYVQVRLKHWLKFNERWLLERFDKRVISAAAHLDEVTPHIHAHFVPIDDRGKVNASAFFGSPQLLREWQDNYAAAMKPLGLSRGISGSKATHIEIGRYYTNINSEINDSLDVLRDKARDRDRAERQRLEMEATARAKLAEVDLLLEQNHQLQLEIDRLKLQLTPPQDISLEDVVYELGLERDGTVAPAKSDRRFAAALRDRTLVTPKNNSGDESRWIGMNIALTINGTRFRTNSDSEGDNQSKGDGAIDLVQHVLKIDQRSSILWLADRFGNSSAIALVKAKVEQTIRFEAAPEFQPPAPDESKWLSAKSYLIDTYGLRDSVLEKMHSQNQIYADSNANAVLLHHRLFSTSTQLKLGRIVTGATISSKTFNGLVPGSSRTDGWFGAGFGLDLLSRVVLADSPFEVLSLASLYPNPQVPTVFLSTGEINERLQKMLQLVQSNGIELVLAFSRTKLGETQAQELMEELPDIKRIAPQLGETWNEQLQKERERLQLQVQVEPNQKVQPKQKSVKGIELE